MFYQKSHDRKLSVTVSNQSINQSINQRTAQVEYATFIRKYQKTYQSIYLWWFYATIAHYSIIDKVIQ